MILAEYIEIYEMAIKNQGKNVLSRDETKEVLFILSELDEATFILILNKIKGDLNFQEEVLYESWRNSAIPVKDCFHHYELLEQLLLKVDYPYQIWFIPVK